MKALKVLLALGTLTMTNVGQSAIITGSTLEDYRGITTSIGFSFREPTDNGHSEAGNADDDRGLLGIDLSGVTAPLTGGRITMRTSGWQGPGHLSNALQMGFSSRIMDVDEAGVLSGTAPHADVYSAAASNGTYVTGGSFGIYNAFNTFEFSVDLTGTLLTEVNNHIGGLMIIGYTVSNVSADQHSATFHTFFEYEYDDAPASNTQVSLPGTLILLSVGGIIAVRRQRQNAGLA